MRRLRALRRLHARHQPHVHPGCAGAEAANLVPRAALFTTVDGPTMPHADQIEVCENPSDTMDEKICWTPPATRTPPASPTTPTPLPSPAPSARTRRRANPVRAARAPRSTGSATWPRRRHRDHRRRGLQRRPLLNNVRFGARARRRRRSPDAPRCRPTLPTAPAARAIRPRRRRPRRRRPRRRRAAALSTALAAPTSSTPFAPPSPPPPSPPRGPAALSASARHRRLRRSPPPPSPPAPTAAIRAASALAATRPARAAAAALPTAALAAPAPPLPPSAPPPPPSRPRSAPAHRMGLMWYVASATPPDACAVKPAAAGSASGTPATTARARSTRSRSSFGHAARSPLAQLRRRSAPAQGRGGLRSDVGPILVHGHNGYPCTRATPSSGTTPPRGAWRHEVCGEVGQPAAVAMPPSPILRPTPPRRRRPSRCRRRPTRPRCRRRRPPRRRRPRRRCRPRVRPRAHHLLHARLRPPGAVDVEGEGTGRRELVDGARTFTSSR